MSGPTPGINVNENGIPDFDQLPLRNGDPPYSAWGLYGDGDELGTLNRLTDWRVAEAARTEIRTGTRVPLNWPLDAQSQKTFFKRALFHQELIHKQPRTVNDDVWTFNTQSSSQWDGLRHYGYQREKVFYNGVTMGEIHGKDENGHKSTVNGIQAWAEYGIVGRGLLVDYHSWRMQRRDKGYEEYDAFKSMSIPLADLKACLRAQGTAIKFGDILIIRSGFMAAHAVKDSEELAQLQDVQPPNFAGVEQTDEMLRWIWENYSAVAGDQPTFERWPAQKPYSLHEVLLSGWGCPIGEFFDLEKLAAMCKAESRWSFFLVSEPCAVPGGVAR